MAKSGNRVHGTLHQRVVSPFGRKAWLVEVMTEEGWTLARSEVIDAGEWNERRNWIASKGDRELDLGSTLGSMDWSGATEFFLQEGLGMPRKEIEFLKANA